MARLRLALWALVLSVARAQIAFTQMSASQYITYCAEAGTTQILTPQCSNGYKKLEALVSSLFDAPQNFSHRQLDTLNSLCAAPGNSSSCVTQMTNLAERYVDGLPPPAPGTAVRDTCEGTLAPNAKPLFGTALPFVCLGDSKGGSCLVEVAQALQTTGAPLAPRFALPGGYARSPASRSPAPPRARAAPCSAPRAARRLRALTRSRHPPAPAARLAGPGELRQPAGAGARQRVRAVRSLRGRGLLRSLLLRGGGRAAHHDLPRGHRAAAEPASAAVPHAAAGGLRGLQARRLRSAHGLPDR